MILMNDRLKKLKKNILESVPTVGTERAWIVTKAYSKYKYDPILIKRAKTLRDVLENMTIYVSDGDLLMGNQGEAVRHPPVYPENSVYWMNDREFELMEARTINPLKVGQKEREELKKIAEIWKGKTLLDKCYSEFPDDITRARKTLVFSVSLEKNAQGHNCMDYAKVLKLGYNGIKAQIEESRKNLNPLDSSYSHQIEFLDAAAIICDAAVMFSNRFAALMLKKAEKERNAEIKQELLALSAISAKVPANPASTFHEAVQAVYFAHLINLIETNAYSMSFGRLDQYLYPYYIDDIKNNRITNEKAQEILNCFWIKINDLMHVDDSESVYFHGGHPFGEHITVGGMNTDGEDCVNELSYMCLDAHAAVQLQQPDISMRFHKNTPHEFKRRGAEVIRMGLGLPQVFNDEVIIDALTRDGIPLCEARDYTPTGCVEYSTCNSWIRAPGGWFNLPKVLELCLHEGKCALMGIQVSKKIKPAGEFSSFEELFATYKEVMAEMIALHVRWCNIIDDVHMRSMPQTSVSLFTGDCIDKAKDVIEGGARYNFTSPLMVGIANITDSLSFIKKAVFERKLLSLSQLVRALDANFEGYDDILLMINNFKERYGNDLDEPDALACDIANTFCDEFEKYQNTRGGKFRVGFWSVTANFNLGMNTAASADGRKKGEQLSDSLSPNAGKDISGLTASLRSVAKLPHKRASNGTVLNRHISPEDVKDGPRLEKLVDLTDGFFELGGSNIGYNIVSVETLKDAKIHPEKHADLMVKVAGYAAYFTELGDGCQDDIIARTEHHLQ